MCVCVAPLIMEYHTDHTRLLVEYQPDTQLVVTFHLDNPFKITYFIGI